MGLSVIVAEVRALGAFMPCAPKVPLLIEERKEDLEDVSVERVQRLFTDGRECCEVGEIIVVDM